ncbi:riboflavin synthase, partial [Chloroflexota bacterium]
VFTGIIQEVGKVSAVSPGRLTIVVSSVLRGAELGGSMAVNGVCLTITDLDTTSFSVDVVPETLARTNLGLLRTGDRVNLEPPLALGGQLGGHLVQGHVDGTARVASVVRGSGQMTIRLEAPTGQMRYIVEKGFITIDGVSLTVASRNSTSFQIAVIDYTRSHTTLGNRRVGDPVNIEVDIIAKYVEQLGQGQSTGITLDLLEKHGFLAV